MLSSFISKRQSSLSYYTKLKGLYHHSISYFIDTTTTTTNQNKSKRNNNHFKGIHHIIMHTERTDNSIIFHPIDGNHSATVILMHGLGDSADG